MLPVHVNSKRIRLVLQVMGPECISANLSNYGLCKNAKCRMNGNKLQISLFTIAIYVLPIYTLVMTFETRKSRSVAPPQTPTVKGPTREPGLAKQRPPLADPARG